ncbi:hypothetical protein ES703_123356 [subsurface metagenome]
MSFEIYLGSFTPHFKIMKYEIIITTAAIIPVNWYSPNVCGSLPVRSAIINVGSKNAKISAIITKLILTFPVELRASIVTYISEKTAL